MLNENNIRELAYVVQIDEVRPIPNYDRVEYARVGGWWVIVRKDQFKVGDPAIYIEVDSKVPETEPFMFLEKRHFKVKTLKMCGVISQGLLMEPADFNWREEDFGIGEFVTERLGIVYADPEDNKRKAPSEDKYKKMKARHPKLFRNKFVKWLMKYEFGRKVMFAFFGKKKDKKNSWPQWVVKTDEERCQNMPYLFPGDDTEWIVTEKIDGTSTTFTMKRNGRRKVDYRVCSRNVVFDKPDKKCFYDSNVYLEMADKYNIEYVLKDILTKRPEVDFVTIQGETYGESIQKRDYGLKGHDFMAFNFILGYKNGSTIRYNPMVMTAELDFYGIPCVPIVRRSFKLPATCDELLEIAAGKSAIDGGMREGLVFRSYDGTRSFKAVSNDFLLKYHN